MNGNNGSSSTRWWRPSSSSSLTSMLTIVALASQTLFSATTTLERTWTNVRRGLVVMIEQEYTNRTTTNTMATTTRKQPVVDMTAALKCLGIDDNTNSNGRTTTTTTTLATTTRNLDVLNNNSTTTTIIMYPDDPYDHYHEIHDILSEWMNSTTYPPHKAAGYNGPWIENYWRNHFEPYAKNLSNSDFSTVFGPYIPLFPPWVDIWVQNGAKYTTSDTDDSDNNDNNENTFIETLRNVLRPNTLYITVSQNDDGFPGNDEQFQQLQDNYNILVLSSGGYGHVPIPLLKQPEIPRPKFSDVTNTTTSSTSTTLHNQQSQQSKLMKIPVANRTHLVSYVGSRRNAPRNMRYHMLEMIGYEHYYYGNDWRDIMYNSKFSFCPRGFGRTSYHIMETLQLGLIPIQVYMDHDIPWIPYQTTILQNLAFAVPLKDVPTLLQYLATIPDADIEQMEDTIVTLIDDYFTFDGVMNQIGLFMVDPIQSALVCQPLPSHPGSNRKDKKWFN